MADEKPPRQVVPTSTMLEAAVMAMALSELLKQLAERKIIDPAEYSAEIDKMFALLKAEYPGAAFNTSDALMRVLKSRLTEGGSGG